MSTVRTEGDVSKKKQTWPKVEKYLKVVSVIRFRKTTKRSPCVFQALQAPACHENMVKVGGYILGEFGNLIAGDPRSR